MRSHKNNLAFIGARGAGKSKLSRKLAKRLRRVVLSTDNLVCYEAGGISVNAIVATEGWQGFRKREYTILKKVVEMKDVLIDCGGGILVEAPTQHGESETYSERKASLLRENATVVYLKRELNWLVDKASDSARPDLGADYRKLLERRLPWYEQNADLTVDLDNLGLDGALARLEEEARDLL